jgi:Glycoside Hydrolase Family 113/Carboxypeptidase regulatory-like domain
MPKFYVKFNNAKLLALSILALLVGCNFPALNTVRSNYPNQTPTPELQQTMITFSVIISQPLPAGDSIYFNLLDEVTGLSFNAHKYIMQADNALKYSVSLPFTIGEVIKYRYSREGTTIVNEHLYNDRPVRYRLYDIEGPATVQDVISRWTDTTYQGPTGRIMGDVSDIATGNPVPNLLVTAGGEQAFTLADGTFLLEGLPPGTHNLVFYALDGGYHIYQQGAVVAADSTTPVSVKLNPAKLVTVIFTIKVPADTPPGAHLRLAGSLYQLGNTYADLSGGVSTLASRMPTLGKLDDGRYLLTLNLPAGTYIEYKYTLGDGLWSSEVTASGEVRLRQMIIPDTALELNDSVETWLAPNTQPIHFEVNVPANTPSDEHVSIQFNAGFGWFEPLPMSPVLNTGLMTWSFDLTGPFSHLTALQYRYCRQEQCGAADDTDTIGINPTGRLVNPSANPGTVTDEVASWAWLSSPNEPANILETQVAPRQDRFIAGAAFQPAYHPSWGPLLPDAINQVKNLSVNELILSPTWTFTNNTPPILETLPSQDMPLPELADIIKNNPLTPQFTIGLYPQPNFPMPVDQWWQQAPRNFTWWVSFFERYSNFILHHATLASNVATPLILGGDWLNPALPGGRLADGSPSNVPEDAEARWRSLIQQIRERYSGAIGWTLTYPDGLKNPPSFLDAVDQIYIIWSAPLATQPGASIEEMQAQAANILDQEILPFQQAVDKPVIIAISYPSIDQAAMGCIPVSGGGCLDYALLAQPNPDIPELNLNLQTQSNAYNAVFSAINERSWVAGYVAMGYYPPAVLQDKSISIHGKPASGVLWYWSQKYLGR